VIDLVTALADIRDRRAHGRIVPSQRKDWAEGPHRALELLNFCHLVSFRQKGADAPDAGRESDRGGGGRRLAADVDTPLRARVVAIVEFF
jgi:hypothetical protein